jgi:hypothetical protein
MAPRRSKYDTKVWARKVYENFGFKHWEFKQLPDELKERGMPYRAHGIGIIDRVGKVEGSSHTSIWQVNRHFIQKEGCL